MHPLLVLPLSAFIHITHSTVLFNHAATESYLHTIAFPQGNAKLVALVKERMQENRKGCYRNIVKLLVDLVYGFEMDKAGTIGEVVNSEFKDFFAEETVKAYKQYRTKPYIPDDWEIAGSTIKNKHGELVYQVASSQTSTTT